MTSYDNNDTDDNSHYVDNSVPRWSKCDTWQLKHDKDINTDKNDTRMTRLNSWAENVSDWMSLNSISVTA